MLSRLLLAATLVPCLALAQEDEAEAGASVQGMPGMPGMNVNIRVKDGSGKKAGKATVHQEEKGDGYRVAWDSDPDGNEWFKVLSPEGAQIRVLDDVGFPKASGTVPVSFRAQANKFYAVEIRTAAGAFSKKFEARPGMITQVWVGAVTGSAPAPAPVAAAGACGSESDLASVSEAISEEAFSAGKLRVLGDVASSRGFCVDHVVKILKLFDFEGDKLSALKLMAPRITDRENKFKVYKALDFDSTRDEAKKILK